MLPSSRIEVAVKGTLEGHSSSKARAALHQEVEDSDQLTVSKGWINFYLMKDNGDLEEVAGEGPVPGTTDLLD